MFGQGYEELRSSNQNADNAEEEKAKEPEMTVAGIRPLAQEQEEPAWPKNTEQNTSNAEVLIGQEEVDIIFNLVFQAKKMSD